MATFYNVPFTDTAANPTPIRVDDFTLNGPPSGNTSLTFVGKNYPEFSVPIGKNFLHLLENFASNTAPSNPITGQLWYDTDSESIPPSPQLLVYDGTNWTEAGATKKGSAQPAAENSIAGDLWADTANQQLYMFNGSNWILVGPQYNLGSDSGIRSEELVDRDTDGTKTVLTCFINGVRVAIISKDDFYSKSALNGFDRIRQGVTMSTADFDTDGIILNKFWGTSEKSDALIVGNNVVPAANFLRSDIVSTTNFGINIRNTAGLKTGDSLETVLASASGVTTLTNKTPNSVIYLAPSGPSGFDTKVITVTGTTQVGINKINPGNFPDGITVANLDIVGNVRQTGQLLVENSTDTTSSTTGSIFTPGGIGVTKSVFIGTEGKLTVQNKVIVGTTTTYPNSVVVPLTDVTYDLGASARKFRNVYAQSFIGTSFTGNFAGNLTGNITGTSSALATNTIFKLTGDVSSSVIEFNGGQPKPTRTITRAQRALSTARVFTGAVNHEFQINWFIQLNCTTNPVYNVTDQPITNIGYDSTYGYWFEYSTTTSGNITAATVTGAVSPKSGGQFITSISDELIANKTAVLDSLNGDYFLLYRATETPSLRKISKSVLFSTAGTVPTGAVFPYAGTIVPVGYLLCDGSEQSIGSYPELYTTIGNTYGSGIFDELLNPTGLKGYQTFRLPDLRGRFPVGPETMDNTNSVSVLTQATNATRNAITTTGAIAAVFIVSNTFITNGPFQTGKVMTGHGLDTADGPVVITNVQTDFPSVGTTTVTVSMSPQITTYAAASGITLQSIGSIDGGGGTPLSARTPAASSPGVSGGSSTKTLTVDQLPQHSHNLKGSTGTQYYALRFGSGSGDTGAAPGQVHNVGTDAEFLPSSGNITAIGAVGQAFNVSNPFQTIYYIIFTGRNS
jgi:microcystin-dependent protein